MMKLSIMEKVVSTVNDQWRSPLAEMILERWDYDPETVYYFRASSNFLFVFRKDEKRYFLRFIDASEKELTAIQSEIDILLFLRERELFVSAPILSKNGKYAETVETDLGTFHAVVFEYMTGEHPELDNLNEEHFRSWGRQMGQMHRLFKELPESYISGRPSWESHLSFADAVIPETDYEARTELLNVRKWAESLPTDRENYGFIHYDFELDNLSWSDSAIGILDFDDSARYWYAADIVYALRDLIDQQGYSEENTSFKSFVEGYLEESNLDMSLLSQLNWFKRLHHLTQYARLLNSVDIEQSNDQPEWLTGLRSKLLNIIEKRRALFKKNIGSEITL